MKANEKVAYIWSKLRNIPSEIPIVYIRRREGHVLEKTKGTINHTDAISS